MTLWMLLLQVRIPAAMAKCLERIFPLFLIGFTSLCHHVVSTGMTGGFCQLLPTQISWNDGQLLLRQLQKGSLAATLFTPY